VIQRSSYDGRTVEEKVNLAVEIFSFVGVGYGGDVGVGGGFILERLVKFRFLNY